MEKKVINVIQDSGCCTTEVQISLDRKEAEKTAQLFAALSDPTRLSILNLLAQCQGQVCVCDITASFTLGQPTISHHLKILKDAGLVNSEKRGKWVHYSLVSDKQGEIQAMLSRVMSAPVLSR
jgi:ArsR family transcriptional regulator